MSDLRVIITGAAKGMGRAHAEKFARSGAKIVVNDLEATASEGGLSADDVAAAIVDAGGTAVGASGDITDADSAQSVIETAVETFGGVDVVVNNAGILRDRAFHKMEQSEWDQVLAVHLKGSYNVTRAAWPYMREAGFGRVIVKTSISGLYGQFGQANYSAAKMGLVGLIRTLAIEGSKYGITANAVSPLAATDMNADILTDEERERVDPAYVSALVEFLASRMCESSGMIIHAGGGFYSRVSLVLGDGVKFDHVPSASELQDAWSRITEEREDWQVSPDFELLSGATSRPDINGD